jgi:predicted permease
MNGLLQDLRFALRQLRKSPAFTTVAVLTLALGIGANTAIFSLINAIMLRVLPVKDPQSLVLLKWTANKIPETKGSSNYDNCPQGGGPALSGSAVISDVPLDSQGCSFSWPFFQQAQKETRIFSSVAAFVPTEFSLNAEGQTHQAHALFVSGDFFPIWSARPAFGRLIDARDDSEAAPPVVVISHRFWHTELGGDRWIVGKHILIGKTLFEVAGITPPELPKLDPGLSCDVWVPLAFRPLVSTNQPTERAANAVWLEILARLQPTVTVPQATAALSAAFLASTTNGPEAMFKAADRPRIELASAARGLATLRRNFSSPIFALLAAVVMVLIAAATNIAGLMLARSAARRKEIAMRVALGATRARVLRQLLTESLLLSFMGGAAGIILGSFGASALLSFLSHNWFVPIELNVQPDGHVLVFTFVVSLLAGIGFGIVPAFANRRPALVPALKASAASASPPAARRFAPGTLIVVAQIALAMPVLMGAGLILRTLANLRTEDVGFNTHNLLVFRVDSTYSDRARAHGQNLYRNLQQQLSALPGVASVSRSGVSLLSNEGMAGPVVPPDHPELQVQAHYLPMSANFLTTMGLPLHQGRALTDHEAEAMQSKTLPLHVVVNQALARSLLAGQNPLGKHFYMGSTTGPEYEITGIVGDAKYNNPRDTIWPTVYGPIADWDGYVYYEVRTSIDPAALIPEIRSAVSRFDSSLEIVGMRTELDQIDQDIYQERLLAALSSLFGALALFIACIGIYGLLSYQVARRTQEIGIRLAVGADRSDVLKLLLGEGAALAIAGAVIGSVAALALTRYLRALLYGVEPIDLLTISSVAVLLLGVAVTSSFLPARRAMKVDPSIALRDE